MIGRARKGVKDGFKGVVDQAKEQMGNSEPKPGERSKKEKSDAEAYERRRQKEIADERAIREEIAATRRKRRNKMR